MARIIWTEPALIELDEIAFYISLDNPDAAKKRVRLAFERIDILEAHLESGKKVEELEESSYREFVFPPCRIFYRLDKNAIYIIHVLRTEQLFHPDLLITR